MPYKNQKDRERNRKLHRRETRSAIYQRKVKFMRDFKEQPCADCGVEHPHYIMEFDHIQGTKISAVSSMRAKGWQDIINEIIKCDVVCANCHRRREWERRYAK